MGTIPAPNIAEMGGQIAAAPANAAQEWARAAALRQQSALTAQQTKNADLQNQIQQAQLNDANAMTKSLQNWDGKDINALPDIAKQNGISGPGYLQLQQNILARKQQLMTLSDEQFKQQQQQADLVQGMHDTVTNAPPELKNQTYQTGLASLKRAGIDVSQEPLEYPGDAVFAQHLPAIRLHSALIADADKDRQLTAEETTAAAKKTEADVAQQNANQKQWEKFPELGIMYNTATKESVPVTGGGPVMTPGMMEAKYVALQQKENAKQPLSGDDQAWKKAYEKYKTLVPVANFNLQNQGAYADSGGNPSAIAQALASGQMKWNEAVSARTPFSVKNAILKQVFALKPDYDTAEFGLDVDAAKKARTGAWADTRVAYNTAIDHADQLQKAAKALNNGDVQTLNSMKNFFKTEFGSPDVPNFNAIANAYNHEVTSVISKGHITDAEVATGHAVMPDNASPAQIDGVTTAFKNLMGSKRDELDKIIKATAGGKANAVLGVTSNAEGGGQKNFFTNFGGQARTDQSTNANPH